MKEQNIKYRIYQLQENAKKLRFRSYVEFVNVGFEKPPAEDYGLVFEGLIEQSDDYTKMLDSIFIILNSNHPQNFTGHSLSISDIIELDGHFYFCDFVGFKQIEFDFNKSKKIFKEEV